MNVIGLDMFATAVTAQLLKDPVIRVRLSLCDGSGEDAVHYVCGIQGLACVCCLLKEVHVAGMCSCTPCTTSLPRQRCRAFSRCVLHTLVAFLAWPDLVKLKSLDYTY